MKSLGYKNHSNYIGRVNSSGYVYRGYSDMVGKIDEFKIIKGNYEQVGKAEFQGNKIYIYKGYNDFVGTVDLNGYIYRGLFEYVGKVDLNCDKYERAYSVIGGAAILLNIL